MGPNKHRGDTALVGFSLLLKTAPRTLGLEEARSSSGLAQLCQWHCPLGKGSVVALWGHLVRQS